MANVKYASFLQEKPKWQTACGERDAVQKEGSKGARGSKEGQKGRSGWRAAHGVRGDGGAPGVAAAATELSKISRTANRKDAKSGARVKPEYFIPFNQGAQATGQKG